MQRFCNISKSFCNVSKVSLIYQKVETRIVEASGSRIVYRRPNNIPPSMDLQMPDFEERFSNLGGLRWTPIGVQRRPRSGGQAQNATAELHGPAVRPAP